jgi:hypothetical protein
VSVFRYVGNSLLTNDNARVLTVYVDGVKIGGWVQNTSVRFEQKFCHVLSATQEVPFRFCTPHISDSKGERDERRISKVGRYKIYIQDNTTAICMIPYIEHDDDIHIYDAILLLYENSIVIDVTEARVQSIVPEDAVHYVMPAFTRVIHENAKRGVHVSASTEYATT